MRVLSLTLQETPPRNPVDALEIFSVREFEPWTVRLSLLVRAYLSTETEKKKQTSGNSKVVLRVCRINRGKAPRIQERGTSWW